MSMLETESLLVTSSGDAAWLLPTGSTIIDLFSTTALSSLVPFNPENIWVVVVGFVIAFILAFAVGANDVANSFGTSVGSKVLTLRQACILAVIFESLGACLLGSQVSDTIWKEIVDISLFEGDSKALLLGEVAALAGTASWLLIATVLKIPVSGTHAIVGATMGFSMVKHGYHGIQWLRIIRIVVSWFVSPVLAGALSGFLFMLVRRFILKSTNPLEAGLRALPIFYAVTMFINTISICMGGAISKLLPWWAGLIISGGLAGITATVVACAVVPWQRRIIASNIRKLKAPTAIPIMCAMNCSVATNLDLLDELAGTGPYYTEDANVMGTSTTTLNILGDTEDMGPTADQIVEEVEGAEGNEQPVFVDDYTEDDVVGVLGSRNTGTQVGHKYPAGNLTITVTEDGTMSKKERALSTAAAPPLRSILQRRSYVYRPPPPPDAKPLSLAVGVGERLNVTEAYEDEEEEGGLQYDSRYGQKGAAEPESNLRMMRYSRVTPVSIHVPMPMTQRISVVKKEPYYLPVKKGDDEEDKDKNESGKPRPNWLVRCWQNIRTLGHREETSDPLKPPVDPPEIAAIFSFLQILTATFTAFAHGGNDVSNAIGPVVAIWVVFSTGGVPEQSSTPIWLLCFGGLGISVGLCVLGRKVIETVGSSLAVIIPSSGFCIGLGTATTVLLCSKIGLPVSTTHCIVGSVVAVGYLRSSRAVNWKVFCNIMGCALITVPVAGAMAAGCMAAMGLLP